MPQVFSIGDLKRKKDLFPFLQVLGSGVMENQTSAESCVCEHWESPARVRAVTRTQTGNTLLRKSSV